MKKFKQVLLLAGLAATITLTPGCALLLLGGVAAGAAYGTVEYVNNALQVTQEVSLDRAWNAANAALKNLGLPVTATQKDGLAGRLEARNAQNQPVIIKLTRQTDTATKIEISVGTFDSAANRTEARLIYDRMKEKF